jgi:hypothetical protein
VFQRHGALFVPEVFSGLLQCMVIVHVLGSEVGGDKRSIGARSERYCISAYLYVCRRAGYTQIGMAISYLAGPQERIHPPEGSGLAWWLSKGKASLRRPAVSVGEPASGSQTWAQLDFSPTAASKLAATPRSRLVFLSNSSRTPRYPPMLPPNSQPPSSHVPCIASS